MIITQIDKSNMPPREKRKYEEKTIQVRLNAVRDIDGGMSVRAVAKNYDVSVGTVQN